MVMPTRRVEMWFGGTTPQRRATVVFRIILAIPQFIVLCFLFIAGFFVLVIGWFGALFTGRLPEFAHTYLGGVIRWEIRVNAYMFLLTDSYPPFSLEDVDYPVRTILPGGGPLNRVSVFFRIILAIPASVFSQIVLYGLTVPLLFVMWIVVIVTGSMPAALYDAYAALLALPGSLPLVVHHDHVGVRVGNVGRLRAAPSGRVPPPVGGVAGTAPYGAPQAPMPQAPPAQPPHLRHSRLVPLDRRAGGHATAGWRDDRDAARLSAAAARTTGRSSGAPGAMPPPSPWERTSVAASVDPLPSWGILVLRGAARSWMIFAIVWGSIVFVGAERHPEHRQPQPHDERPAQHGARGHVGAQPHRRPRARRPLRSGR